MSGSLSERATLILDAQGNPAHAVIPYADYIRVIATEDAIAGVTILDDPNTEWIDYEQWLADLAGPKIAAIRKSKGWTQKQLGDKLGMPQSQVSRMEKHTDTLTYRTLKRVAKVLGVEVSALL